MGTYTQYGPFTDNSAPGIDAAFLNGVETWIDGIDHPIGVTVNGQTSGTATIYPYWIGNAKRVVLVMNNYKTTGSQTLALPAALVFTQCAYVTTTETQGLQIVFLLSGSAQTVKCTTSMAAGGGSQTAQAYMMQWDFGLVTAGFDTIKIQNGPNGTAATGIVIVEGI